MFYLCLKEIQCIDWFRQHNGLSCIFALLAKSIRSDTTRMVGQHISPDYSASICERCCGCVGTGSWVVRRCILRHHWRPKRLSQRRQPWEANFYGCGGVVCLCRDSQHFPPLIGSPIFFRIVRLVVCFPHCAINILETPKTT